MDHVNGIAGIAFEEGPENYHYHPGKSAIGGLNPES